MHIGFRFKIFLALLVAVMLTGVFGFMITEKLSLFDSIYFSIVTVATVGYGDIYPVTPAGKILAIILIITGAGAFLGVIANATELMLYEREKETRMEKLKIIIGLFFSEAGSELLSLFIRYDPGAAGIRRHLAISAEWSAKDFLTAKNIVKAHKFEVSGKLTDFEGLRHFMQDKSHLFLRLMENQNLLEHTAFTDLLRAILHIKEELLCRSDLQHLPDSDYAHIAGDMKRAYGLLVPEWLAYMQYLKNNYPYLFSLAVRMNPFNEQRSPIVN